MAPTNRSNPSDGGGAKSDHNTTSLAALVARLESMELLKEEVAALKSHAMFLNKSSNGSRRQWVSKSR
ncbi:hypothetical protein HanIR_Chr06g0265461 [Helianthus annuus]|nr:hypothetical protein HanIR_Chr06g0265461 [Helianthus annuus]